MNNYENPAKKILYKKFKWFILAVGIHFVIEKRLVNPIILF